MPFAPVLSAIPSQIDEHTAGAGSPGKHHAVPAAVLARAKAAAASLFAGIGVKLEWKEGEPRGPHRPGACAGQPNEILEAQFDELAGAQFPSDAMAYAVPGKAGICIHIFYNRVVAAHSRDLTPVLLGHVPAHEIGHGLEGIARHSEEGLMKARWSIGVYMRMSQSSLPIAEEDAQLMRSYLNRSASARARP